MTPRDIPFRLLDPSGRTLVWVRINGLEAHHTNAFYQSDKCRIVAAPRIGGPGTPQDNSRPCFRAGTDFLAFRLRDEVHEWLEELGFGRKYQFEFRYANGSREPGWYVGFLPCDTNIAALFKLAWGSEV